MEILLAIIPDKIGEIEKEIELVRGLTDWVQLDIMDGVFVPPITWPYAGGSISELNRIGSDNPNIELHLMVQDPETVIDGWMGSGVRRMLIHAESTEQMGVILDKLKYAGIEAGIALDLETPPGVIEPYVNDVSVVQLMSIDRLGYHGAPFSEKVLPKIKTLRERYPHLTIQVDGGMNLETGKMVIDAGANNLVVGSAILKSNNIKETINEFRSIKK
jgi:ribulose-phosphate 3-epimerase